jgi:hypothetical protein
MGSPYSKIKSLTIEIPMSIASDPKARKAKAKLPVMIVFIIASINSLQDVVSSIFHHLTYKDQHNHKNGYSYKMLRLKFNRHHQSNHSKKYAKKHPIRKPAPSVRNPKEIQ